MSDHNAYLRRRHGSVDTNTVADPRPAPGLLSPSRSPTKRQAHRVRSSSALPERSPSQFAQGKGERETSDLFDADSVGSSDVDEGDQERLFSTSLGQVHQATPKHSALLSAALLLCDWPSSNPAPRLLSTLNHLTLPGLSEFIRVNKERVVERALRMLRALLKKHHSSSSS